MTVRKFLLAAVLASWMGTPARAEELTVKMSAVGGDRPGPFQPQLWVRMTNESFMSSPLLEKIKSSQLIVDGRAFPWSDKPFKGPPGLSPQSSWEGCLPLEDYIPDGLAPGTHAIQLNVGGTLTKTLKLTTGAPVPPAASPEERLKQVRVLKDLLSPGLLRGCVENWLPQQDGGLQIQNPIRYYLKPGVKVFVSYEQGQPEPRVTGRIRMYTETRILD